MVGAERFLAGRQRALEQRPRPPFSSRGSELLTIKTDRERLGRARTWSGLIVFDGRSAPRTYQNLTSPRRRRWSRRAQQDRLSAANPSRARARSPRQTFDAQPGAPATDNQHYRGPLLFSIAAEMISFDKSMQVRSRRPSRGLNRATRSPVGGSSASFSPNRLSCGCPATMFRDILGSAIGPLATPERSRMSDSPGRAAALTPPSPRVRSRGQ